MLTMAVYAYAMATHLTETVTEGYRRRLADARERGDIVSTLVLVGIFVIMAAGIGTILWKVVLAKANNVSNCVNSASSCSNSAP